MAVEKKTGGGKTEILIVEDSPTQREELRYILERAGYDVVISKDGEEALAMIRNTLPSLIISDIIMPGMDGYQLCRQLKSDEELRDVPVLLLTALSDPQDVIKGLECGADDFLTKPYEEAHLLYRIQHTLTNAKLRSREPFQKNVDILFRNKKYSIRADRLQILNLLLSTYEVAVLKNKELAASQKRLEAANKELEAFSYAVSHDLRAPLRSIDGFSRALIEDCADFLDATGKDHLRRIHSAVKRMNDLIDALLTLSRLTRKDIKREMLHLTDLVKMISAELQRKKPDRRVDFIIEEGVVAEGDGVMLKAALENLLGNAWKFTEKQIPARIEFGSSRKGERLYYVRDNGAGFDMHYADKLFDAFQRLHSSEEFPGVGIGLATVQRIIRRHGGRIWAEGEVEKGATFYFTLWDE